MLLAARNKVEAHHVRAAPLGGNDGGNGNGDGGGASSGGGASASGGGGGESTIPVATTVLAV